MLEINSGLCNCALNFPSLIRDRPIISRKQIPALLTVTKTLRSPSNSIGSSLVSDHIRFSKRGCKMAVISTGGLSIILECASWEFSYFYQILSRSSRSGSKPFFTSISFQLSRDPTLANSSRVEACEKGIYNVLDTKRTHCISFE